MTHLVAVPKKKDLEDQFHRNSSASSRRESSVGATSPMLNTSSAGFKRSDIGPNNPIPPHVTVNPVKFNTQRPKPQSSSDRCRAGSHQNNSQSPNQQYLSPNLQFLSQSNMHLSSYLLQQRQNVPPMPKTGRVLCNSRSVPRTNR